MQTAVDYYEVQVADVTLAPETLMHDWVAVGNVTSYSNGGIDLQHEHTYVTRVRAWNVVGSASPAIESDGFTVDLTPPVAGTVLDGGASFGGVDADLVADWTSISASWHSFYDEQQAVVSYTWCVGTAPGTADVVAMRDAGTSTEAAVGIESINLVNLLASAYVKPPCCRSACMPSSIVPHTRHSRLGTIID